MRSARGERALPGRYVRASSPRDSLSEELPDLFRLRPTRHEGPPGILIDNNPPASTMWGRRKGRRRNREGRRRNEVGERRNLQSNGKNKTALTLLGDRDQSLFPKGWSSTILLACLGLCRFLSDQFHFPILPRTRILVPFCICTYLYL